jgi:serine/threonine protein kinase
MYDAFVGAFGVVYCASISGFTMAIKMVHAKNDDALAEIKHEMTILKQCRNKHIVGYYGCWGPDSKKRLWLLMDYCGAGSVVGELMAISSFIHCDGHHYEFSNAS